MQHPFPFARLKIPILDLYGEDDYPAVQRMAPERLTLIEEGGKPRIQPEGRARGRPLLYRAG